MSKYFFDSGLYEDIFYTKHKIDFNNDSSAYVYIEYDNELLAEHYQKLFDFEYIDEDDRWEKVDEEFWNALSYWPVYFEPLIFNEEAALECNLTPFTYKGVNMLALSGCGMNLSPKLDAYQALTHNSIDRNSILLDSTNEREKYFEYVVGEETTKKVWHAIFLSKY